jgi:uncharacterized membrane protein HdeD (DUF308 family)
MREHWVVFLVEGIVLVMLGLMAIVIPPLATLAVAIFLGWLFLISGIVGLITTFMANTRQDSGGRSLIRSALRTTDVATIFAKAMQGLHAAD